jgi:hypothetical protein
MRKFTRSWKQGLGYNCTAAWPKNWIAFIIRYDNQDVICVSFFMWGE